MSFWGDRGWKNFFKKWEDQKHCSLNNRQPFLLSLLQFYSLGLLLSSVWLELSSADFLDNLWIAFWSTGSWTLLLMYWSCFKPICNYPWLVQSLILSVSDRVSSTAEQTHWKIHGNLSSFPRAGSKLHNYRASSFCKFLKRSEILFLEQLFFSLHPSFPILAVLGIGVI